MFGNKPVIGNPPLGYGSLEFLSIDSEEHEIKESHLTNHQVVYILEGNEKKETLDSIQSSISTISNWVPIHSLSKAFDTCSSLSFSWTMDFLHNSCLKKLLNDKTFRSHQVLNIKASDPYLADIPTSCIIEALQSKDSSEPLNEYMPENILLLIKPRHQRQKKDMGRWGGAFILTAEGILSNELWIGKVVDNPDQNSFSIGKRECLFKWTERGSIRRILSDVYDRYPHFISIIFRNSFILFNLDRFGTKMSIMNSKLWKSNWMHESNHSIIDISMFYSEMLCRLYVSLIESDGKLFIWSFTSDADGRIISTLQYNITWKQIHEMNDKYFPKSCCIIDSGKGNTLTTLICSDIHLYSISTDIEPIHSNWSKALVWTMKNSNIDTSKQKLSNKIISIESFRYKPCHFLVVDIESIYLFDLQSIMLKQHHMVIRYLLKWDHGQCEYPPNQLHVIGMNIFHNSGDNYCNRYIITYWNNISKRIYMVSIELNYSHSPALYHIIDSSIRIESHCHNSSQNIWPFNDPDMLLLSYQYLNSKIPFERNVILVGIVLDTCMIPFQFDSKKPAIRCIQYYSTGHVESILYMNLCGSLQDDRIVKYRNSCIDIASITRSRHPIDDNFNPMNLDSWASNNSDSNIYGNEQDKSIASDIGRLYSKLLYDSFVFSQSSIYNAHIDPKVLYDMIKDSSKFTVSGMSLWEVINLLEHNGLGRFSNQSIISAIRNVCSELNIEIIVRDYRIDTKYDYASLLNIVSKDSSRDIIHDVLKQYIDQLGLATKTQGNTFPFLLNCSHPILLIHSINKACQILEQSFTVIDILKFTDSEPRPFRLTKKREGSFLLSGLAERCRYNMTCTKQESISEPIHAPILQRERRENITTVPSIKIVPKVQSSTVSTPKDTVKRRKGF